MPLKAKDRPHAGYKSEDETARSLKNEGHSVKQMDRNSTHDMNVDGKRVEVKAAIKTSYKGSDGHPITGHVFSNMKANPKNDKYILKCLSPDRKKTLKTYEIPSSEVKQRTLTITDNGKYEKFKKQAFLSHKQPARRNDVAFEPRKKRLNERAREYAYELTGAALGALVIGGPQVTLNTGKAILGLQYKEEKVNFNDMLKMSIGMAIGRQVGSTLESITKRQKDEQIRSSNQGAAGIRTY